MQILLRGWPVPRALHRTDYRELKNEEPGVDDGTQKRTWGHWRLHMLVPTSPPPMFSRFQIDQLKMRCLQKQISLPVPLSIPGPRPSGPSGPQSTDEGGTLNILGQSSYCKNTKFAVDVLGSNYGPNHLMCDFGKVISCLWTLIFLKYIEDDDED